MKKLNSNIYLIGMMGSGKSTIGRMLADKLNKKFIDTDDKIEEFTGLKITEIFEAFGEKRFREMEESYFIEKSQLNDLVISTGGGIIISPKNRKVLKSSINTIYLKAQPKILVERVSKKKDKRPLLMDEISIFNKLTNIYNERNKLYEQSANYIIETDMLTKIEKFNKVLSCLH